MPRVSTDWLTEGVEQVGARRKREEEQAAADVVGQLRIEDARSAAALSRWSGLPVETVARNRQTIERDKAGLRATSALTQAPQLGRWLAQDQRNAASVQGDEVNAAAISYWFGDGPGSYTEDYQTTVEGRPAWAVSMERDARDQLGRRRTADEILRSAQVRQRAEEERERMIEAGRPDPTLRSFGRGVLAETKQGFRQSWIGTKMFIADAVGIPTTSAVFEEMLEEKEESDRIRRAFRPRFDERNWGGYTAQAAYGGTSSLLQMVPALAAAPFTSGTSLLTLLGLQSGTSQYAEVRGRGGTANEALASGTLVGGVEAATEMLPMGFLVSRFGKVGAGEFISGFLGRELVTEQVATHVQDAIDTAIANPDKTWGEYMAERPDAAFDTLVAAGIMSGAVGSANALYRRMQPIQRDLSEATDAIAGARFLDQAIGLAQDSQMRKDDPVAFRSFIENHTAGSPVENVYVPAEALQSYFQSADFDANVHEGWAQYAEQVREAAAIGGDVVIPTADAMDLLSEGNAWDTLRDTIRLSPGGISLEEARSIEESYLELMRETGEQFAAEATESAREQAPGRQVYDFVLTRARASGMSLNAAQAYADLYQSRYETRAAQRGTDAWSLFTESVSDIRGEAPSAVRQYRTSDRLAQLVTVMQRGNAPASESQRRGPSLLEFIAARGGIEDPGGDIASMGGAEWHRQQAFRRRLLRPADQAGMFGGSGSRYSINDNLVAALEAGYFPELAAARDPNAQSEPLDDRVLLEAIGRELAGDPVYSEEMPGSANQADEALREAAEDLAEYLRFQGLDPYSMSLEEIRAAIEPTDPRAALSFSQGVPPETFEVDGKERPTRNSLGQPIARSVEGIRAFWRWFGESRVVDERGRPLVVFHGTNAEAFDTFEVPAYFTERREWARNFGQGRIEEVYLRIVTPEEIDGAESGRHFEWDAEDVAGFRAEGKDGVLITDRDGDGNVYTVFDPEQVKAVGNETFSAVPSMFEQGEARPVDPELVEQDRAFWRSVLVPPEGYSDIVLNHNGPENLPRGKPTGRFGNYFGSREFSETFGAADFGPWRYTYFMPQAVADAIVTVEVGNAEGLAFARAVAERAFPDETAWHEEIEAGDQLALEDFYGDLWTDPAHLAPVLAEMGLPGARYGGETFLLPETVQQLADRRQGPDDGTVSFYQSAKAQEGDPWFYSSLDRAVSAGQAKATAEQWIGTLRNAPGVKAEELEWSGLVEFLDAQPGTVARDDILAFLRSGGIRVEEVVLGDAKPREVRELVERLMEEEAQRLAREELDEFYDPDGAGRDVPPVTEIEEDGEVVGWEFDGVEFATEEAAEEARDAAVQSAEDEAERERFDALRDMHWRALDEHEFHQRAMQQLGAPQFPDWTTTGEAGLGTHPSYRELLLTLPIGQGRNPQRAPATHWDQEAVVAHMRFQEKRDAQGRPVLFLEELQSDWHQKGRDEGYNAGYDPARAQKALERVQATQRRLTEVAEETRDEIRALWNQQRDLLVDRYEIDVEDDPSLAVDLARVREDFRYGPDNWAAGRIPTFAIEALRRWPKVDADHEGWDALDRYVEAVAVADLADAELRSASDRGQGVPDAPFRSTWPTLLLKRAIRWAVDNGYHAVAWTHGAEQGDRYGLTQTLTEIVARPTEDGRLIVAPDSRVSAALPFGEPVQEFSRNSLEGARIIDRAEAERIFGAELAERMFSRDGEERRTFGGDSVWRFDVPGGIRVGGEGMVEFYDRIVPRAARDLVKRHGAGVAPMAVEEPEAWQARRDAVAALRDRAAEMYRSGEEAEAGRLFDQANEMEAAREREAVENGDVRLGFEITPALADAARRGFSLFQGGSDKPRGRIDFEASGRAVINLFENADLSTLLHESGHLWLEELRADAARPDAPQQVKDDWATVKAWFKAHGYTVASGTTAIPTDAHEMWARGFERYAMEGKAPSSALARAFRSFTAWLLRLYRHVNNLNTPLTDEVRSVMDRLLATQEAIDAASAGAEQDLLFRDAAEAGMTEEEFAAWQASVSNAKSEAFDALLYRTMAAVRKRRTAEWNQRKQSVTTEVVADVSRRPEFRALAIIRGRGPVHMPLDRQAVIDEFGTEILAMLPRGVPPTVRDAGGFSPQLVAEAAGFRTAQELVDALVGIETRQRELRAADDKRTVQQEEIDRLVEVAMLERYGDSLSDGSIEEEALAEIHNDQHGDRIASELRSLARRVPRSTDNVPTPWQQARAWAERVVEEGVISEQATAAALARHQRNEGKARRAAFEAFRRGDAAEAFKQKQRELHHAALYRAASNAKERTDVIVKRLGKLAAARKHASIHWEYLDRIHQLLEHFDFRRRSGRELKERTAFAKWAEAKREAGEEVFVPDRLLDADAVNFMHMRFADLVALDDTVESIAHLGRRKSQLLAGKEEAELEAVVAEAVARAESLPALPVSLQRNPDPTIRSRARGFDAELIKMERLADYLDNGDPNGAFNRVLIQPATQAANYKQELSESVLRPIQETYLAMPKAQQKRLARRVLVPELVTIDENGQPQPTDYSGMDLLAIALNTGNESNLSKMLRGESRGLPPEHAWTVDKVMAVLNRELTEQDWRFVEKMWRQVDSLWPHIVQAERELTGVKPEKVVARPVVTPFGTIEGGYYPVVYDPLRSRMGSDNADEMAEKMFGNMGRVVSTPKGHTITRTNAAAPLLLSVEGVLLGHVDKVATRIAYGRFVRDALKFTSHEDIRRLVSQRMGPEYYPLFKSWLHRQTSDAVLDTKMLRTMERFLRAARKNVTMVGLGFRVTTMLAQTAGWSQSVGVIGERYMIRGMIETFRHMGRNRPLVFAKSQEMASRLVEFDREVRDTFRDMQGKKTLLDRIRAFGFWGIINVQMQMVDLPTWWGGYLKGIDGGMSEDEATAFADKAVRKSQSSGRAKDLSEIQSGSEAHKWMTMFYSFFNAYYNLQAEAVSDARIGNWKAAAHTTFWIMMVGPMLGALLTGDWPDDGDDGELGLDDIAEWMARKFFFGLFAGIPIARDFANGIERKVAGEYSSPPSTPIVRVFEEFETFAEDSIDLASGDEEIDGRWVQRAITVPGYVFGLPTGQLGTTSRYIFDVANEDVEPEDAEDVARGLIKGRQRE